MEIKTRKIDIDNERIVSCILCGCISTSQECEIMFEIQKENVIFVCSDCIKKFKEILKG